MQNWKKIKQRCILQANKKIVITLNKKLILYSKQFRKFDYEEKRILTVFFSQFKVKLDFYTDTYSQKTRLLGNTVHYTI